MIQIEKLTEICDTPGKTYHIKLPEDTSMDEIKILMDAITELKLCCKFIITSNYDVSMVIP